MSEYVQDVQDGPLGTFQGEEISVAWTTLVNLKFATRVVYLFLGIYLFTYLFIYNIYLFSIKMAFKPKRNHEAYEHSRPLINYKIEFTNINASEENEEKKKKKAAHKRKKHTKRKLWVQTGKKLATFF